MMNYNNRKFYTIFVAIASVLALLMVSFTLFYIISKAKVATQDNPGTENQDIHFNITGYEALDKK